VDAAIWGFVGVLVGAAAAVVGQWLINRHESRLDSDRRDDDRRIERERFERKQLLAVQDATKALLTWWSIGDLSDLGQRETFTLFMHASRLADDRLIGMAQELMQAISGRQTRKRLTSS
jgi:hypothetical protein